MPDDDHWLYRLAEGSDAKLNEQIRGIEAKMRELGYLKPGQKLYQFFKQPGGLIQRTDGQFDPNPEAENIENLDGGYAYYYRQAAGKSQQWIKAQILAQYASVTDGKPIYPEYNDSLHCKEVEPLVGVPLILGFDYGRTPACSICQLTPRGQFRVLDELCGEGMGIRQFARDALKPHMALHYPSFQLLCFGDPAGLSRGDIEEKDCFMALAEEGFHCVPTSTNVFSARRDAVASYLLKMSDGWPAFAVSPKAKLNRSGLNGRYHFDRIQIIGHEAYRDLPDKHDPTSHPCDATQYAALGSQMNINSSDAKPIKYPTLGIV
jgi:hypothetical protein